MLTETQIKKLQALVTSQKYGKLLEDAIKTWSGNVGFIFQQFGVNSYSFKHKTFIPTFGNKCCLVGAALIGKEKEHESEDVLGAAIRIFKLEQMEIENVWRGFDCPIGNVKTPDWRNDAFMFGYDVKKILLSETV